MVKPLGLTLRFDNSFSRVVPGCLAPIRDNKTMRGMQRQRFVNRLNFHPVPGRVEVRQHSFLSHNLVNRLRGVLGREQSIVGLMNRKFQLCFVVPGTRPDYVRPIGRRIFCLELSS